MTAKLDQSLDDILKTRRTTNGRGRGRRVANSTRVTTTTTRGAVSKSSKTTKASKTAAQTTKTTTPVNSAGESKIIVTGLPSDVSEQQIKEYFAKTIGPVKKVMLTYGANGQSRGVATIVFNKAASAVEAAMQLNGVKVDNRAMKIEVVVGAKQPITLSKTLSDRIAQPKSATKGQAKASAGSKDASAAVGRRGRSRRGRDNNTARAKPKTAQELDAEMTDYFDGGANATANGGTGAVVTGVVQQNAISGGETGMEDEIM